VGELRASQKREAIAEWRERGEERRGGRDTYCSAEAASLEGDGRRDNDSGGVPGIGCADGKRLWSRGAAKLERHGSVIRDS
jgi:hypothetical protein